MSLSVMSEANTSARTGALLYRDTYRILQEKVHVYTYQGNIDSVYSCVPHPAK